MPEQQATHSHAVYERACRVIPAGVSSDARRARPGRLPLIVSRGEGPLIWDADGREIVDFVLGQGPMVLGHAHPAVVDAVRRHAGLGTAFAASNEVEVVLAERLCDLIPGVDQVRFNTVGSEATLGAVRVARGLTGRQKVLKFEGHYHGWLDPLLWNVHPDPVIAGSPLSPSPVPGSGGLQRSGARDLILATWNDLESFERAVASDGHDLAAVIMEPVLCNTGCISAEPEFLAAVRAWCTASAVPLIFDEVITGFRLGVSGAREYSGVIPDISVYGKALGGGLPVAAVAGRAEVMEVVTDRRASHAGTFNSNPLGMAAALATVEELSRDGAGHYEQLYAVGRALMAGIRSLATEHSVPVLVDGPGPMFQVYFTEAAAVRNYREFAACDHSAAAVFHETLLDHGVNTVARGLWFLSSAHGDQHVDRALDAVDRAFARLRA